MLAAQLLVRGGKHEGKAIPLARGRFLIGREQDCNLRPASDMVSRHHCVFHVDDFTVRLRDLGSTNGTLVNGERLSGEKTLKAGDRVTVGRLSFELDLRDVSDASEVPTNAPVPAELQRETAPAGGNETSYELPVSTPQQAASDTRFDPASGSQPVGPNSGDTQVLQMPPGGFPQQGYPPQYPGYPPQYPGYPPQYPGYPPQYPGYPPQYPQYPQQGGPPPQGGEGGGGRTEAPPVKLPPPPQK